MDIIDSIFQLFNQYGASAYIGEPVTQLEHALQTAQAARRYQANPIVITAALLHDIGHLLHHYAIDCRDAGIDSQHELVGSRFLETYFHPNVSELVKQHVNAKRYLTATNPKYLQNLSAASCQSLALQGGPMQAREVQAFEKHPLLEEILCLRYWDEGAKIPNKRLIPLTSFLEELKVSLK